MYQFSQAKVEEFPKYITANHSKLLLLKLKTTLYLRRSIQKRLLPSKAEILLSNSISQWSKRTFRIWHTTLLEI